MIKNNIKCKKISINLNQQLFDGLHKLAAIFGSSATSVIRLALFEFLKKYNIEVEENNQYKNSKTKEAFS